MKKLFLLLLVLSFSFSGCEKDDICDASTSTTPRLIIEFYDALNPTVLKNVTNLKVTGEGVPASTAPLLFLTGSKIQLPLKTDLDSVKFELILNSTNPAVANTDYLEFNYTRENVFVSRACGFKTIFKLNNINGVLLTDKNPADGLWMQPDSQQKPTIVISNIVTENETHIKIYI